MENIFEQVSIEQFKEFFCRDFPFLPNYDSIKVYWKDDIVFSQEKFYQSLKDNNTALLSDTTAWQVVNIDKYNYILDADIIKAKTQAMLNANSRFGENDCEKINIFLHLWAYYLVVDLKNSSAGVGGGYTGVVSSKHVGDVSESYAIPQWMTTNPMYSIFGQNGYGLKYLSLIAPYTAVTLLYSRGCTSVE